MKPKLLKLTAFLLIIAGAFTACNGKEYPFLSIDKTTITVPAESGTFTISASSNGAWTAVVQDAENNSWLTLANASGINDGVITVNIDENPYFTARNTAIKISMEGLSEIVLVEQEAADNENDNKNSISGTWKVRALNISDELVNISRPETTLYPNILIIIPDTIQGYIDGNTFYSMIEAEFEINEEQQIRIENIRQFVENQLIIWLNPGVDAYEFAANSNHNIRPKERLGEHWNVWLFETDGTVPLRVIVSYLLQHPDVRTAQHNHTGITWRSERVEVNAFLENMRHTVKFDISKNELIFLDAQNNPLIVFINPTNTE